MTTTAPLKTLADFKRRIAVGTRLLCIHNTYRPKLNGTERTVVRVMTVAFTWRQATADRPSWTHYPKARDVVFVGGDEIEWNLFAESKSPADHEHTLRLKLLD